MTGKHPAASTSRQDQPAPWFWCKTCSRIFPEKDKLATHKREVHPEELLSPIKENKKSDPRRLNSNEDLLAGSSLSSEALIHAIEERKALKQPRIQDPVPEGSESGNFPDQERQSISSHLHINGDSSDKKNKNITGSGSLAICTEVVKPIDGHRFVLNMLNSASAPPPAIEGLVTNAAAGTEEKKLASKDTTAVAKTSPMALPTGKRGFACQVCGLKFQRTKDKAQHFLETHGDRTKYKCEECNTVFSSERALDRHKALHLQYSCVECHRKFDEKTDYDEHLKSHERKSRRKSDPATVTNEHNHQVDLLEKLKPPHGPVEAQIAGQSKEEESLEKSSSAVETNAVQALKNDLSRNETTIKKTSGVEKLALSTGVSSRKGNRFVCEICSQTFTAPSSLSTHMNLHTGAKPFSCRLCTTSFSSTSARHKHESMHKMNYQQCPKCYKLFKTSKLIDSHLCKADAPQQQGTLEPSIGQQEGESSKSLKSIGRKNDQVSRKNNVIPKQGNGQSVNSRLKITDDTARMKRDMCGDVPSVASTPARKPSGKPKVVLCFGSPKQAYNKVVARTQVDNIRADLQQRRISKRISSPKPKIHQGRVQKAKVASPGLNLLKCGHCGKTFGNPLVLHQHERNHIRDKLMQTAARVRNNHQEKANPAPTTFPRPPKLKSKDASSNVHPSSSGQNQRISLRKTIGGITISPVLDQKASGIRSNVEQLQAMNVDSGTDCDEADFVVKLENPIGDMRFRCSECSKLFKKIQTAKIHALIHTGERPHKCYFCDKTFRQYGHRYRHVQACHKDQSYRCGCGDTFVELKEMKNHMQKCSSAEAPAPKQLTRTPTSPGPKRCMPVLSEAASSSNPKRPKTSSEPLLTKLLERNSILQRMQRNSHQTPSPEKECSILDRQSKLLSTSASQATPTKSMRGKTVDRTSLSPQILPSASTDSRATAISISTKKSSAVILPPISMKTVFQCPVCDVRFFEQPLYDKHMEWHRKLFKEKEQPKKK